jgi:hypothetical protein
MKQLCVVALSVLLSTGVARADDDCDCDCSDRATSAPTAAVTPPPAKAQAPRGEAGWRTAFWSGVAVTGGMIVGTTLSARTVLDREDHKLELTRDLVDETGDPDRFYDNACTGAIGIDSATARELRDTCSSGQRWATITNLFYAGTLASALFTGYAAYRGFFRRAPESSSRMRITPQVGPSTAGAVLELDF